MKCCESTKFSDEESWEGTSSSLDAQKDYEQDSAIQRMQNAFAFTIASYPTNLSNCDVNPVESCIRNGGTTLPERSDPPPSHPIPDSCFESGHLPLPTPLPTVSRLCCTRHL